MDRKGRQLFGCLQMLSEPGLSTELGSPTRVAITCCLPGCNLAGSWNEEPTWHSDPDSSVGDTGIPSNVLIVSSECTMNVTLKLLGENIIAVRNQAFRCKKKIQMGNPICF